MLVMAAAESAILFSSIYVAGVYLCGSLTECLRLYGPLAPKAAFVSVVMVAGFAATGLYELRQRMNFRESATRICVGLCLGGVVLAGVFGVSAAQHITPDVAAIAGSYALVLLLMLRYVYLKTIDENIFRRRTVILGAGERAANITSLRRRADRRGFMIVGQIPVPGDSIDGTPVYTTPDGPSVTAVALEQGADEIVVAVDDRRGHLPLSDLLAARLRGIDVIDLVEFLQRETGKIRVDLASPGWLVFSPGFQATWLRRATKRLFDVSMSVLLLALTAPLMMLIAVAIKLEDGPGAPVFYSQLRVGQGGRLFRILKFRSMRVNAEADGKPVWAARNDPRISRIGGILRRTHVDELPQLINVIAGSMSIVGPRPERPEFAKGLAKSIPFYSERHTVRPGVTGWAQIRYSYGASKEDASEKLQYDLYYVKNHNLLLDIFIILQTVEMVLWRKGSR